MDDLTSKKIPLDIPIEKLVFRNLKRAYDTLHVETFKLFKNFEITLGQFDLMETILLSEKKALSVQEIAVKTVSLQPNITREIAALTKIGLVSRTKNKNDRRTVLVQLTERGKQLLKDIQKPLLDLHFSQFKEFTKNDLYLFNEFLENTIYFQKHIKKQGGE